MGIQNRLNDNIIPVIEIMKRKKISHTEAFKEMSENLGITKQSVLDSCVRRIGLRYVKEFSKLVETNGIKKYLKKQYPELSDFLEENL